MASLSDFLLKTLVRVPLSNVNFTKGAARSGFGSIRELMHHGYTNVSISGKKSFKVDLDPLKYHDVIESSFYLSAKRCFLHSQSLDSVCENSTIPKAWAVVSIYYSGFFSAMTLLNMAGIWPIFFSQTDVDQINQTCGVDIDWSAGTYLFTAKPLASNFHFIAKKVDGGGGIHALVWSQIKSLISVSENNIRQNDIISFRRLKFIVSSDWGIPSEVRNNWNYKFPEYYGSKGEGIAAKAKFNQDWLFGWVKKNITHPQEADRIIGLYYAQYWFGKIVAESSSLILPPALKGHITKVNSNKT
jgi:hypothetical protein